MREIEDEILDEIVIDINELPAIVFMPILTDFGLVYNSFNMPTKHIREFLAWLNSQQSSYAIIIGRKCQLRLRH